jgi:NOL1/NOP2/sun family putative RNA methylase
MKLPIIPKDFKARYAKILGEENKEFLKYCTLPLRKCIRINTLKVNDTKEFIEELKNKWKIEKVPFCNYAYFVNQELELGKTEEYFLGKIYVQEASSLIPPIVLNPSKKDFVLDSCAAPGSKTTQLAQIMNNKGCIVANDINFNRIKSLRFNLELVGAMNTVVTRMSALQFSKFPERFDKILVDAPCSCEGVIRKNWNALSRWNLRTIRYLSHQQKKILRSCFNALKKDGVLVYSTCTLTPEENEEVVDYALKNFDVKIEEIRIPIFKVRKGILEWEGKKFNEKVSKAIRIYPQDNNTEGFFVAKFRKL